jgi:hypothetical protein
MGAERSDIVRWVRRYEAAERRIAAERRASRLDPEEALSRALDLTLLVEEVRPAGPERDPTDEDLRAYETWARLRRKRTREA